MSKVLASMALAGFFYIIILISFRLLGKRELNQLSAMDIVMNILIANIAAAGIVEEEFWLDALGGVVVIVCLQLFAEKYQLKHTKLRDIMDGEPCIVVMHGKIMFDELSKSRIDLDDLVMMLREQDIVKIEDIQYAVMERNGKLTVHEKQKPSSMFPLPLIVSGQIKCNALKYLGYNEQWLKGILEQNMIHDLKKIELLFFEQNKLVVYVQCQMKKIKIS